MQENLTSFLPLLLFSIFAAISAYLLAKDKGRNVVRWTVLGAIPGVNLFCIWFFIGATNLRLERKLDALLNVVVLIQLRTFNWCAQQALSIYLPARSLHTVKLQELKKSMNFTQEPHGRPSLKKIYPMASLDEIAQLRRRGGAFFRAPLKVIHFVSVVSREGLCGKRSKALAQGF